MPQATVSPIPGPTTRSPMGVYPQGEDAPGPEQGLYITLPEHLTLRLLPGRRLRHHGPRPAAGHRRAHGHRRGRLGPGGLLRMTS